MPTVLWETDDSFDSKYIIWSGSVTQQGSTLYADYEYAYICTVYLYRLKFGMGSGIAQSGRDVTNITPTGNAGPFIMTHYLNEWGDYFYSISLKKPFNVTQSGLKLWQSNWPETSNSWNLYTWSGYPVDIIFPNYLEDRRVVIGVNTSGYVKVLPVTNSGIGISYFTDWSAMESGITVTDLEARIII